VRTDEQAGKNHADDMRQAHLVEYDGRKEYDA
jgi:hypothetical protein